MAMDLAFLPFNTTFAQMDTAFAQNSAISELPNITFAQINVSYVESDTVGGRATVKNLVTESSRWLDYSNLGSFGKRRSGVWLHVAKAASKKDLSVPSKVQVSKRFLILVACFNFIKFAVMFSVLVIDRSSYLVTLGDAASSFLEQRDRYTIDKCLLSREGMVARKDLPKIGYNRGNKEIEQLHLRLQGSWLPYSRSYFSPYHDVASKVYAFLCRTDGVFLFLLSVLRSTG
ncbi:uncharacterized protein J4E79_010828 [Alternaria viburni]|uniref:uncharacterized protein n=1 Tax=Alternaria viburni TaxID=566460 RepID=UPI0020C29B71|nr:uncharacterized protein J4E79_010828 [Alternaria viburni]KAI4645650.1 hypothetical protein J4E79_010828 [Alternaria viburni]